MRRPFRLLLSLVGLLLVAAVGLVVWAYFASQHVDPFYREALAVDRDAQKQHNHEMLRQSSALVSNARRPGQWQAKFTADQINGWLAVDLVQNHGEALPPEFSEPRVSTAQDLLTVGVRYNGSISSVIFLEVDAKIHAPNVLAIRIRRARAGNVPLPLSSIIQNVLDGARESGWRIEERQIDGDPLLLVTLPPPRDSRDNELSLDALQLSPEGIFVSGRTQRAGSKPPR